MKKITFTLLIFTLALSSCSNCPCNNRTPGWGSSLGEVSFVTDSIWTIGYQIWSDAVQASNCNKTTFLPIGRRRTINADCRSNPNNAKGDLFSWCAVMRFADILCPAPWRVPTKQDFIDLDIALGNRGRLQESWYDGSYVNRYITYWGAVYGVLQNLEIGRYWSQTKYRDRHNQNIFAFNLFLRSGQVSTYTSYPNNTAFVAYGAMLRCVRDK